MNGELEFRIMAEILIVVYLCIKLGIWIKTGDLK